MSTDKYHQLQILETLEAEPQITQADLAARVNIAVGTVNWYLKQWSKKGWLKVRQIGRWRWEYILTPKGVAEKTRLAGKYLEHSMRVYRKIRDQSRDALESVKNRGYQQVVLLGKDDVAEICGLTCLEMGIQIFREDHLAVPRIETEGSDLVVVWPEEAND
jgi:DNA-binding MarR family transcriptional regulator